jgi:hypothetical protein
MSFQLREPERAEIESAIRERDVVETGSGKDGARESNAFESNSTERGIRSRHVGPTAVENDDVTQVRPRQR